MTDVFLDPYLLTLPRSSQKQDYLEDYLEALLEWQRLLEQQGLRFLKSDQADLILYQDADSPTWDHVSAAKQECGAIHVQQRDIIEVVEQFLRRSIAVEAVLDLEEFAVDSVEVQPSSLLSDRPNHFIAHCYDLLMLAGLQQRTNCPPTSQFLASKTSETQTVIATFTGHALWRGAGQEDQDSAIDGSLSLPATASALEHQLDPVEFWKGGYFDGAVSLYLRVRQTEFRHPNSSRTQAFRFAPAFYESLKRSGFMHETSKIERLLRALAETITGLRLEDVHALRTGVGGNSPQRRRNRDLAWRRDIDREYHLHYWATTQGPEFVQVGVHNDFDI